eukprot:gene52106-19703_t
MWVCVRGTGGRAAAGGKPHAPARYTTLSAGPPVARLGRRRTCPGAAVRARRHERAREAGGAARERGE